MRLNALLMTRDRPSLRLLGTTFGVMRIEQQTCQSAAEAVEMLVQGHHSALVLDFDLPGADQVARMARLTSPRQRPVVFGMVSPFTPVGGAFQSRVNFVLYKPLEFGQVARSLRAGHGFMPPNPRRSHRHKLETLVYLQLGVAALPAVVLDLSEQGMALQAPEPLPPVQNVPLRFVLPGTPHLIEAVGEVIWADEGGRAGMFFSHLTPAARIHLKNWLTKRGGRARDAVSVLMPPRRPRHGVHSTH